MSALDSASNSFNRPTRPNGWQETADAEKVTKLDEPSCSTQAVGVRFVLLLPLFVACAGSGEGSGHVEGVLEIPRCRASGAFERGPYAFDAERLSTDRYDDVLLINIAEHLVELEEADGLIIRVPNAVALSAQAERPIVLGLNREAKSANATLSLFETCPTRPSVHAVSGTMTLETFVINANAEDTGDGERIRGTLTASVASSDREVVAGHIRATFDFAPPKRLLREVPDRK